MQSLAVFFIESGRQKAMEIGEFFFGLAQSLFYLMGREAGAGDDLHRKDNFLAGPGNFVFQAEKILNYKGIGRRQKTSGSFLQAFPGEDRLSAFHLWDFDRRTLDRFFHLAGEGLCQGQLCQLGFLSIKLFLFRHNSKNSSVSCW